ncbi:MAG: hypothetical protein M4579_004913 [Chaenotheca gracillima]|nr:MAG: hypothetical protein M4579_004913 [Chaenotheca gracillima]
MPAGHPDSTDVSNSFEDLSRSSNMNDDFENPYDAFIQTANGDDAQIQSRYETHRLTRNAQQRAKLLDANFSGVTIDPILKKLEDPSIEPGYRDPRHCLVFWARPPAKVRALVSEVQRRLHLMAPSLWTMHENSLHLTALEITHSQTAEEISKIVDTIRPHIQEISNYTLRHRARVLKPLLSYDGAALALSFLPAHGEGLHDGRTVHDDAFTYHHLRRDLYNLCKQAGVTVESRYTVPSSHLTVGRYITDKDFTTVDITTGEAIPDPAKMRQWIAGIENINDWLRTEFWPADGDGPVKAGGEWIIGEEKGLDCRFGALWYGDGGRTLTIGDGF